MSAVEEANLKWLEEGGSELKRAVKEIIDGESRLNMDREQVDQIVMKFMQNVIIRTAEKVHGYKRQRGGTKPWMTEEVEAVILKYKEFRAKWEQFTKNFAVSQR